MNNKSEPPIKISINVSKQSMSLVTDSAPKVQRKPSPSLYFSCRFCDVAIASVTKIKDHIKKRHNIHEISTEHYTPSFKKVYNSNSGGEEISSFVFQCISCSNTYFSKDDVIFHVKNSHDKGIGVSSSGKNRKSSFQPPLKKDALCDIRENSLSSTQQTSQCSINAQENVITSNQLSKKQKITSKPKPKKINYYKELGNFLVDKNKTKKLELWGGLSALADKHTSSEKCSNEDNFQVVSSMTSGSSIGEDSIVSDTLNSATPPSVCYYSPRVPSLQPQGNSYDTSVNSKRGRKPKFVKNVNTRKGRLHCGVVDCAPCSITNDCGRCNECINKKIKK